jgi:outer membrane biogenesis lipoprotein LolB
MDMKKLLFLFLAVTLLTACDEKATDDSLSVSKDLLEFKPEGGTQEFQIFSNTGWKIIVADENSEVYLSFCALSYLVRHMLR